MPTLRQRFKRLHGLSVVINGMQWLAVFAALSMLISFQPIAGAISHGRRG